MTEQQYPLKDDATIVLGPEVFVAEDGSVINWAGVNYVPQAAPPSVPTREQIAEAVDRAGEEYRLSSSDERFALIAADAVLALLNEATR